MSEFSINPREVKNKVDELTDLNRQLKSEVAELTQIEEELVGMWEGDARDMFHGAYTSDKGQMDNFTNVIDLFARTLDAIAAKNIQTEAMNVETAQTRNY